MLDVGAFLGRVDGKNFRQRNLFVIIGAGVILKSNDLMSKAHGKSRRITAYPVHGDALGVETPIVLFGHTVFFGEMNHPSLLENLGANPLGLLDGLNDTLNRNIGHVGHATL